ncbi:MAG: hypothetical protein VKK62_01675 [Synechococcaceae cyanobacterium]|nr:hypothetical protein [Synechococcaceae cyanobacterium]
MSRAMQEGGIKPEHALAFIGLGLMNGLAEMPAGRGWAWAAAEEAPSLDVHGLRQRLELVQLALQTGAPLSTAEVTLLLGARPGAAVVQRGGLTARRLARNVWRLSRSAEPGEGPETSGSHFREGFRRRL